MTLENFLIQNKILLLDGATGSQLIAHGLKAGECPELWNIEKAEKVKLVVKSYFNAGSDAVLTNTFGGSPFKLKSYNLENKTFELNYAAAKNAIAVKPEGKMVLGSIGPSGQFLEPFGEVTEEEMIDNFGEQIKALVEGGVDGFMLETFIDLNELLCAAKAVKKFSNLHFITSMTFNETPDGYKTMMGVSVAEAAQELTEAGALVVGSNCGNGIKKMIEVGQEFRSSSPDLKVLVKTNAGEPKLIDGETIYTENADFFKSFEKDLFSFSPSVIGGCCGTSPEHIKVFRGMIDNFKSKSLSN